MRLRIGDEKLMMASRPMMEMRKLQTVKTTSQRSKLRARKFSEKYSAQLARRPTQTLKQARKKIAAGVTRRGEARRGEAGCVVVR